MAYIILKKDALFRVGFDPSKPDYRSNESRTGGKGKMQTNNAVNTAIAAFLVAVQLGLIVGIPKLIIFLIKKKKEEKTKKKE